MRFWIFVLISLIIHLLFNSGLVQIAEYFYKKNLPNNRIDIELIPTEAEPQKQVVRQVDIPEKLKIKSNSSARFRSEKTQRVSEETKANLIGKTVNSNPKPQELQKNLTKEINPAEILREMNDLAKAKAEFKNTLSATGESLPQDIKIGSMTALNTDEYLYYSFYARTEDLVRFRWEEYLRRSMIYLSRFVIGIDTNKTEWTSDISFKLLPDGTFYSAQINRRSGIVLFDQAPIKAFQDAKIIPNPPKELVQDDGYIHLRYSFNVRYRHPRPVSREGQ